MAAITGAKSLLKKRKKSDAKTRPPFMPFTLFEWWWNWLSNALHIVVWKKICLFCRLLSIIIIWFLIMNFYKIFPFLYHLHCVCVCVFENLVKYLRMSQNSFVVRCIFGRIANESVFIFKWAKVLHCMKLNCSQIKVLGCCVIFFCLRLAQTIYFVRMTK